MRNLKSNQRKKMPILRGEKNEKENKNKQQPKKSQQTFCLKLYNIGDHEQTCLKIQ